MKGRLPIMTRKIAFVCSVLALGALTAAAQDAGSRRFTVTSTTFENDKTLPLSMILDLENNGVNVCSIDGHPGGNKSPELSWTNVPRGTRSFVVIAFDTTAGFIHWGMYDIPGDIIGLPEGAGVAGSTYGKQVVNNFGSSGSQANREYDGPCPPPNYPPNVHHYVFTVYALDIELGLYETPDFPPTGATLFRQLIETRQHILASASITGLYSTTPD